MPPRAPSPEALGRAIRAARGDRFTQVELARRAGLDRSYLNKIEAGGENPSYRVLCDLAEALGIGLSELIARAERSPSAATQ